jgi:hypothetical protein
MLLFPTLDHNIIVYDKYLYDQSIIHSFARSLHRVSRE